MLLRTERHTTATAHAAATAHAVAARPHSELEHMCRPQTHAPPAALAALAAPAALAALAAALAALAALAAAATRLAVRDQLERTP